MAVTVYRHPLLLLEAEELVYALVNGIRRSSCPDAAAAGCIRRTRRR